MPTDEETETGFRVLVKQRLKSIDEKLDQQVASYRSFRDDHEQRLRDVERRANIICGFALALSSLATIGSLISILSQSQ